MKDVSTPYTELTSTDEQESKLIPAPTLEDQLEEYPKLYRLYSLMKKPLPSGMYALTTAAGMALFNLKRGYDANSPYQAWISASISLICNITIGLEYCIEPVFKAIIKLNQGFKSLKNFLPVVAGTVASITLTAQLVHSQPVEWAIPIALSAFLNYFGTRTSGLCDGVKCKDIATIEGTTLILLPLVFIWLQDTAELIDAEEYSASHLVKDFIKGEAPSMSEAIYGTLLLMWGGLGAQITTLFYGNACLSLIPKYENLYSITHETMQKKSSLSGTGLKLSSTTLSFMMFASCYFLGFESMNGFAVSTQKALQPGGELDFISTHFTRHLLPTFVKATTGLVNTSSLTLFVTKKLKSYNDDYRIVNNSSIQIEMIDSPEDADPEEPDTNESLYEPPKTLTPK